ncbi:MAG: CPBP family intramembrane glutamic endopeptidase [Actinomycetota bacterium]|nr:CPBP family intramembrane glutamic endopeptidase [Actinomycetota bacterium]
MSASEDDRHAPQDEGASPRPVDSGASWTRDEWDRMWRPSMWLQKSPGKHGIHAWHIVAIVALTAYANVIANRVLDPWWHIPFNLGILGVAVAIARHAGAGATDLGYRRDRIGRGLVVGGIVMGVIGIGILIGVALPVTRDMFRDDRVIERSTWVVLFDALLRIPIATAFYEETLFRGVLFGLFARRWAPLWAALASSLLFGLWHILPTLDTLLTNPAGESIDSIPEVTLALAGSVVGTALAGLVFLWLRLRANSTVASVMAHIATNSFALLAALFVVRVLG